MKNSYLSLFNKLSLMFWVGFEQIVFSFIPSVKLEHLKYEMLEIIHKSKIRNTKNIGNVT
jgi:hypothetical protein